MEIRLQKYLADSGICSRRKAEEYILAGRVKVNGEVINTLGTKVDDEKDKVYFDNKLLKQKEKKVYLMLNKPEGYVTTVKDQFDRKTVMDLIKDIPYRVVPIGRLDYDTSGLLLFTNDGEVVYKLTHPKHNIDKVYEAKIKGIPSKEEIKNFENGLYIDNYKTSKAKLEIIKTEKDTSIVRITIHEGKNRQVRKMCEKIGHSVIKLKRISIGNIKLGNLPVGEYRILNKKEENYIKI